MNQTFQQATGKTIQQAFEDYHKLNPKVFTYFENYDFEAINAGKKKISFKMIMNVIRWTIFIKTEDPTLFNEGGKPRKFRINDAYGSRYARLFIDKHPEHANKIELRNLRS